MTGQQNTWFVQGSVFHHKQCHICKDQIKAGDTYRHDGDGLVHKDCETLCSICCFPKSKHRPEKIAHHSECTLENFKAIQ